VSLAVEFVPFTLQGGFVTRTYTNEMGTPLRYSLYVPGNYNPAQTYPLVLYFHAANTSPLTDLGQLVFVSNSAQLKHPSFFLAPYNADNGTASYFWDMQDDTVQMLASLEKEFRIDPDRIYISGASLGGVITWYFVARYPNLFAAAVTVSGEAWQKPDMPYPPFSGYGGLRLPFWVFHAADDSVNSVSDADTAVSSWRGIGGSPIYTRYRSGGHVPAAAYATPGLVDWVMVQRRGTIATNAPFVSISNPDPEVLHLTGALTLDLAGTAIGLTQPVTQVTLRSPAKQGITIARGTNQWTAANIPLEPDQTNLIVVTAATSSPSQTLQGTTTFNANLNVLSLPVRTTIALPMDSVFIDWTGGAPPYRVQQTSDPSSTAWTDAEIDVLPPVWLPRLQKRQFYRVVSR
jgi:pimeloyl-ACP methyl ester carboxylesterase